MVEQGTVMVSQGTAAVKQGTVMVEQGMEGRCRGVVRSAAHPPEETAPWQS